MGWWARVLTAWLHEGRWQACMERPPPPRPQHNQCAGCSICDTFALGAHLQEELVVGRLRQRAHVGDKVLVEGLAHQTALERVACNPGSGSRGVFVGGGELHAARLVHLDVRARALRPPRAPPRNTLAFELTVTVCCVSDSFEIFW